MNPAIQWLLMPAMIVFAWWLGHQSGVRRVKTIMRNALQHKRLEVMHNLKYDPLNLINNLAKRLEDI